MLDIEELVAREASAKAEAKGSHVAQLETEETAGVRVRNRKRPPPPEQGGSFVPGAYSVFVRTWGCGHNNSDGTHLTLFFCFFLVV